MSDPAERASEVDPLKAGEVSGAGAPSGLKVAGGRGLSRLSGWRTAAFLLSLFLCLTVVFAFSFILPCPVRPQYLRTWNRTLPGAVTYDFLAVQDCSQDKVQDVLFIFKASEGSQNNTCSNQGLPSPCLFVLAVDGTDGETLWERPLTSEFDWAECGVGGVGERGTGCLLAHADTFTAIDTHTGAIVWQQPRSPGVSGKLPVLSVPDLDGDGARDVAVVSPSPSQTVLAFLSGKTGALIGSEVVVDPAETAAHLLHTTSSGAPYLLLQRGSGLYAMGLWWVAVQAGSGLETKLKRDPNWEKRSDSTGLIPIYESESLRGVLSVKGGSGGSGAPPLLLLQASSIELLHGDTLASLWRSNTSSLLSEPSFGHYNKDHNPDVVIEEDTGNGTKRVTILDGHTGGVLWQVGLRSRPHSPRPSSVFTINSYSVFMLWGETPDVNDTIASEESSSYLLHPLYSNLLLGRRNPFQHVIASKATLLERGRHACYLILTGPSGEGDTHGRADTHLSRLPVVLTKRKIKDDVPESRVLRVGRAAGEAITEDREEFIKEAFNRLRFSDEA